MIVFNLDEKPLSKDLRFCNDYSSQIIKSAISTPILRYNSISKEIEQGLCKILLNKPTITVLGLNNWLFNDGTNVEIEDVKRSIYWLRQNSPRVKYLLEDITKFYIKGNKLIIQHKRNINFLNKFTSHLLSVFNDKIDFSGLFYIKRETKDELVLANSPNNRHNVNVKFKFVKNNYEDVELYKKGQTSFTNPTTFPMKMAKECKDLNVSKNFIFFNLSFVNKKLLNNSCYLLRKTIYNAINRDKIAKKLHPLLNAQYDFKLWESNDTRSTHLIVPYKEPVFLDIGYDDYYPNKIICEDIKKNLEPYNIFLNLVKTNFRNRKNNVDLQLNLLVPDYLSNSYFYCSKYFQLLFQLAKPSQYNKAIKLVKKYEKTGSDKNLNELKNLIDSMFLEIPLFCENAVYLSKNKDFNFVELNYDVF